MAKSSEKNEKKFMLHDCDLKKIFPSSDESFSLSKDSLMINKWYLQEAGVNLMADQQ